MQGLVLLTYSSTIAAINAVQKLSGQLLKGNPIKVMTRFLGLGIGWVRGTIPKFLIHHSAFLQLYKKFTILLA